MKIPTSSITLYELDFNLWLEQTANLLKQRQLEQLDYDNLIEEIELLASKDTGLNKDLSPVICPFDKQAILNPEYLPEN